MTTPTNPEGVPDPAVAGLIEEARQLVADCTHEDAWDEDAVAIAWRVEHRTVSMVKRLADELERVARQPGRDGEREGWKLVPDLPTQEMSAAGCDQWRRTREAGGGACYSLDAAYRAYVAAAPSPQPVATVTTCSACGWPYLQGHAADCPVGSNTATSSPPSHPVEGVKRGGERRLHASGCSVYIDGNDEEAGCNCSVPNRQDEPALWSVRNTDSGNVLASLTYHHRADAEAAARKRSDNYAAYGAVPLYAVPLAPKAVGVSVEALTKAVHDARTAYYLTVGPRNQGEYIVRAILKLLEAHHAG